jgi:hypothetical protein
MINIFGIMFIMSMVFAVGAIEADQWLFGMLFAIVGILSGMMTLYLQAKLDKEKESTQLYYKED